LLTNIFNPYTTALAGHRKLEVDLIDKTLFFIQPQEAHSLLTFKTHHNVTNTYMECHSINFI